MKIGLAHFVAVTVVLAFAALLGACGDEGGLNGAGVDLAWGPAGNKNFAPPAQGSGSPMEGDWFTCESVDCSQLDGDGIRFAGNGRLIPLDSRGDLDPGETYCENLNEGVGAWSLEGPRLIITDPSGRRFAFKVQFSGSSNGRALLSSDAGGGQAVLIARIDPPRSTGPCRNVDVPLPGIGGSDDPATQPPRGG